MKSITSKTVEVIICIDPTRAYAVVIAGTRPSCNDDFKASPSRGTVQSVRGLGRDYTVSVLDGSEDRTQNAARIFGVDHSSVTWFVRHRRLHPCHDCKGSFEQPKPRCCKFGISSTRVSNSAEQSHIAAAAFGGAYQKS